MSTITSVTVIQVIAIIVNIVLITLVFSYKKAEYKNVLVIFLIISLFWSISSLMTNMIFSVGQAAFWGKVMPMFALGTAVSYAYFIAVFTKYLKNARIIIYGGAFFLVLLLALVSLGLISKNFTLLVDGTVRYDYGAWYYFVTFCSLIFLGSAVYSLWKRRGSTTNPEERNRITYLFLGICFVITFEIILKISPLQSFFIHHIGMTINAIILTYIAIREHPADIKQTIKNGAIIAGVAFFLFDFFLIFLNNLVPLFQTYLTNEQYLAIVVAFALALSLIFNPIRRFMDKITDSLLYGKRNDYRQMVLDFVDKMNYITEMPELDENMLKPMAKALSCSQVSLLLDFEGYYQTLYAERQNPEEPVVSVSFRGDGPIVEWLNRNDAPLFRETIMGLPEFEALWKEERDFLEVAHIDFLYPIKARRKLVAILGFSQKHPRGIYTQNDMDLIRSLSGEAAVVIENALLYAEAKGKANTDDLTLLFNHRYFHECLEREIYRSSRFGSIFSLIIMDIDGFKKYNDINGHLSGDEVLKQIGKLIQRLTRKVDLTFRYGGDEFAILLPETPVQGAKKIGETLRVEIETSTDTQGMPISCSLGIGSWPADGMIREEIIHSVDTALYYAKQNGKNRTCLTSEVNNADILKKDSQSEQVNKRANLDAIYALAATVDAKDSYTYGHSKKLSKYAVYIAEAIGYSSKDIERIRTAALLHDIGKIGIADNILNKPGYLTPEDFEPIKAHPDKGVSILKNVDSLKDCLPAVRHHHERYDGTGYPAGLKGDDIPLDARILAVADTYDAMTSRRPYRQLQASKEQAIEELQRCAGTQFDPKIVHVFVNILRNEAHSNKPLEEVRIGGIQN